MFTEPDKSKISKVQNFAETVRI